MFRYIAVKDYGYEGQYPLRVDSTEDGPVATFATAAEALDALEAEGIGTYDRAYWQVEV